MKTYPFIRILINLHWLLLLMVIGFLTFLIYDDLSPKKITVNRDSSITHIAEKSSIAPELLLVIKEGKALFRTNCATCHNKNMKSDMTGPALAGIKEKWSDFPEADLYDWIRNSSKMVDEEHPLAIEIYNKWNRRSMTSFTGIADEKITAILTYIESVK